MRLINLNLKRKYKKYIVVCVCWNFKNILNDKMLLKVLFQLFNFCQNPISVIFLLLL